MNVELGGNILNPHGPHFDWQMSKSLVSQLSPLPDKNGSFQQ